MKKKTLLFLLVISLVFSNCVSSSYFYSPTISSSNPYHAIPLQSDSTKGATYVSGIITLGGANESLRDNAFSFQGRIHRSNNFGNFQAYYGANLTLGVYHVSEFDNYYHSYSYPYYDSNYHYYSSNNFFGSYGFNGGINAVISLPRGEWRPIGIETSVQREFGSYYSFRKNLPDSAANGIFKKNTTGTIGIYTDIIHKSRHGAEFGYKLSFGFVINPSSDYAHVYNPNAVGALVYISNTLHLTKGNVTGFAQINLGNAYAANVQLGINYQLGKKKK